MKKVDEDAKEIADLIIKDDIRSAHTLWDEITKYMKFYEMVCLRSRIQKLVEAEGLK